MHQTWGWNEDEAFELIDRIVWNLRERICTFSKHKFNDNGFCKNCCRFRDWTAFDWLKHHGLHPHADDMGRCPISNSQLRRWLDGNAVTINGRKIKADEEISFPITKLVFFNGNKRQVTFF